MRKSVSFQKLFSLFLAANLGFSPMTTMVAHANVEGYQEPGAVTAASPAQDRIDQALAHMESQVEAKGAAGLPLPTNKHRLLGQKIYIYNGHAEPQMIIDLDKGITGIPALIFSQLKAYYKASTRELIIQATRGANDAGELGLLIAEQVIPNYDIASLAQDNEMLCILNNNGSLDLIDWGWVVMRAFKAPIPVVENAWKPSQAIDLSGQVVSSEFVTRGVWPVDPDRAVTNALVRRDQNGKAWFDSGDLLVTVQDPDTGERRLFATFSRETNHHMLTEGAVTLAQDIRMAQGRFNELTPSQAAMIEHATQAADREEAEIAADIAGEDDSLAPASTISLVMASFPEDGVAYLHERSAKHNSLGNRHRDTFDHDTWLRSFDRLRGAAASSGVLDTEMGKKWKQLLMKARRAEGGVVEETRQEEPKTRVGRALREARQKAMELYNNDQLAAFVVLLATLQFGTAAVDMAAPHLIPYLGLSQVYETLILPVLRDESYRGTLMLSTASLFALWFPLMEGVATSTGWFIRREAQRLGQKTTAYARYMRDLSRNWGDVDNWQRISTAGMRVLRYFVYPPLKFAIEIVGRQRGFRGAMAADLNPAQIIWRNSEMGRRLGLNRSRMVGFSAPFNVFTSDRTAEDQRRIQNDLIERKKLAQIHAARMAIMIVSAETGVDPLTLLKGTADQRVAALEQLLSSAENKQQFNRLALALNRQILKTPFEMGFAEEDLQMQDISTFYKKAQEVAAKIKSTPRWRQAVNDRMRQFKRAANIAKHAVFVDWGSETQPFMANVYVNKDTAKVTKDVFVADWLIEVLGVALVGARANLAKPENLAADANGVLWTGGPHWVDIGMTAYVHFFQAGARNAMQFQRLEAKDENGYGPWEEIEYSPLQPYQDSFLNGMRVILGAYANPIGYNVGNEFSRNLKNSATLAQASISMSFLLRVSPLANLDATTAILGAIYTWFTQWWYFAWMWPFYFAGNKRYKQLMDEMNAEKMEAQRLISLGLRLRGSDDEAAGQMVDEGVARMKALYEKFREAMMQTPEMQAALNSPSRLLQLSAEQPPVPSTQNGIANQLVVGGVAVATTLMAIPMITNSTKQEYLTTSHLTYALGGSVLGMAAVSFGLSKDRLAKLAEFSLVQKAKAGIRRAVDGCKNLLKSKRTGSEE